VGFFVLCGACLLVGGLLVPLGTYSRPFAIAIQVSAGILVLHLCLQLASLFGKSWSAASLAIPLLVLYALAWAVRGPRSETPRAGSPIGWGDALAVSAVAIFGICAARLWVMTGDFVYHWGAKGQRFFLAHGIDYTFLQRPWNWMVVPWYPTTLSELYAVTGLVESAFRPSVMMLWSVLFMALAAIAAREALLHANVRGWILQAGVAFVATATASIGISLRLAGGAEWMIAFALMAGCVPLLAPLSTGRDAEGGARHEVAVVALASATAAASKVEGAVLAVILIGVFAWRDRRATKGWKPGRLAAVSMPTVLVLLMAHVQNRFYSLLDGAPALRFPSLEHLTSLFAALASQIRAVPVHGLPLVVLLFPLTLALRRTRWMGMVIVLQLAFYLAVYALSRGAPDVYVNTSLMRLMVHVFPAVAVSLFVAASLLLEGRTGAGARGESAG
jgi:hypothetical protein